MSSPNSFILLRQIGEGSFGKVYRAISRKTESRMEVAIKKTQESPSSEREATIMGRIPRHPNVCEFYESWVSLRNKRFIVMELIENGEELKKWLDERKPAEPIAPSRICQILLQIFAAIAHIHEHNIYHGDIKPSNIMIIEREDGTIEIKLIDFGLASYFDSIPQKHKGSPMYFSPEIASMLNIDHTSDIWAMGIVILQILTGIAKPWFLRNAANNGDVIYILNKLNYIRTPFPRDLLEHKDPNVVFFASIAQRCLALDKSERPRAQDVVIALTEKLAELELAELELAEQEPVDQERADQEPVDQERVDQERVDQEPVDQERADQERVDQERVDQEPVDQEPVDQELAKLELAEQVLSEQKLAFDDT
jgi:serine/threonine protein kinase